MEQGRFVRGNAVAYEASGRKRAVKVLIPDSLSTDFSVISKDYLPDDTDKIKWVCNVGLNPKGTKKTISDYYEVQVSLRNFDFTVKQVYVYIDGEAQALSANEFDVNFNGNVSLRLNLADPPIGVGGG